MPRLARQLISVAVAATLALMAMYGSYRPMRKAELFRQAYEKRGTVQTAADFEALMLTPLEAPSPIGQVEQVRDTAAAVLAVIRMEKTPVAVTADLANFVNAYFEPVYQGGKGIGFTQALYYIGAINVLTYVRTGRPDYLRTAERLLSTGLQRGPRRPEFLYALLDVYRMAGNTEKVKAVAETILRQWPEDQGTRTALADYLARPRAHYLRVHLTRLHVAHPCAALLRIYSSRCREGTASFCPAGR